MSNETETQTDPPSTSAVCLTTTWDGQLVLLGTIVTIQLVAAWWPPATVLTAIPLLALANRTHSPASNATRPSRFYLACLLIAGTSVLGELREIASFLSAPTDDSSGVSAASLLATAMPRMIARVVIPFAAGLVGLIIFGQLEAERKQADGATISTQWVQRLSEFLQQSDAPVSLLRYTTDLGKQLSSLSVNYESLSQSANESEKALDLVTASCQETAKSLRLLCDSLAESQRELTAMRTEMNGAKADLGQLQSQVDEMGDVLEQFCEIAEHRVMQYHPTAANH